MATKIDCSRMDKVIQRNIKSPKKPCVLILWPGYKLTGGWTTDKPAIVATVGKKLDGLTPKQMLPAEVEDVPVDVREATGMQRLRAADPAAYDLMVANECGQFHNPHWKSEPTVFDSKLVPRPQQSARGTKAKKDKLIKYTAPPNMPLAPVTRSMSVIAHARPEDGYPVITDFLAKTTSRLTVAMNDFSSGDLLNAMKAAISPAGGRPFQIVLDHPPHNPTANQTDDVTVQDLRHVDPKAKVCWALEDHDLKATKWIYPTAYRIKGIVRECNSFWLSSGNLNVSNQPNLAANDPQRGGLSTADREWHVIVLDQGLAQLYEAYIDHDFVVASSSG